MENFHEGHAWALLGMAFTVWIGAVCAFFYLIKNEYIKTFYDFRTASGYMCQLFKKAATDEQRWVVFKKHWSYSSKIRKEIKMWVGERWADWCQDPPAYFKMAQVPKEVRPGI